MALTEKSEFEGKPGSTTGPGLKRFGGFGLARAWEKLRLIYRAEQDPGGQVDFGANPDKWRHGGIESIEDLEL